MSATAVRPASVHDILGSYWDKDKPKVVDVVPPTTWEQRREALASHADAAPDDSIAGRAHLCHRH